MKLEAQRPPRIATFWLAAALAGLPVAAGGAEHVYWTESGIRRADLDGSNQEIVVPGSAFDVAIDKGDSRLYWITGGEIGQIRRAQLDGSGMETLVTGIQGPWLFALDPAGGKVYWTEAIARKIWRADLDGSNVEDLLELSNGATGIALDVPSQKMYVSDSDLEYGWIVRANLDGTGAQMLCCNFSGPAGIALDLGAGKMYWAAVDALKVRRANLDGSGNEDLATASLFPIDVDVDPENGKMYFTGSSWGELGRVWRANLDGSALEIIREGSVSIWGIALDRAAALPPHCGNGTVDAGEECDDGNDVPGDGCEPDCTETIAVPAASRGASLTLALLLLAAATALLLRRP